METKTISLEIDGKRGQALESFAAFGGKTPEELILDWIKDKVDHSTVTLMRGSGATWDDIAQELGTSITQARRIYAAGSEFQSINKEDLRVAEKYLDLMTELRMVQKEFTENHARIKARAVQRKEALLCK